MSLKKRELHGTRWIFCHCYFGLFCLCVFHLLSFFPFLLSSLPIREYSGPGADLANEILEPLFSRFLKCILRKNMRCIGREPLKNPSTFGEAHSCYKTEPPPQLSSWTLPVTLQVLLN